LRRSSPTWPIQLLNRAHTRTKNSRKISLDDYVRARRLCLMRSFQSGNCASGTISENKRCPGLIFGTRRQHSFLSSLKNNSKALVSVVVSMASLIIIIEDLKYACRSRSVRLLLLPALGSASLLRRFSTGVDIGSSPNKKSHSGLTSGLPYYRKAALCETERPTKVTKPKCAF
jgi:hypothetical protein